MFTGIVEELGAVRALDLNTATDSAVLTIEAATVTSDLHHGDSISVNGVCLTVTAFDAGGFAVDVMAETLNRSALGGLAPGAPVNLERAMPANGRFGGHIVQGHVDGVARLVGREHTPAWDTIRLRLPAGLGRYVVEKGSITVDGVSLTVAGAGGEGHEDEITIGLIPTTLELTTLGRREAGDSLNIEVDVLAKYTERLLRAAS